MAQTYFPLLTISLVVSIMVLNSSFLVVYADEPKAEENKPLEDAPGVPMVPEARKFGHHHDKSRVISPSQAPEGAKAQAQVHGHHNDDKEHASSTSETTSISDEHGHGPSSEVVHVKEEHLHHHHFDGSVAGGGIIIASLATAFVTAIFCYIRATRRTRQMILNKEQLI